MLYALAHPVSLALLLVSYLAGLSLHGWVQAVVADKLGDRRPRTEKRLVPDPRVQVDPYGAVSALIAGLGWARPVELPDRRRRGAVLAVALSGPLVNVALGVGLLLTYRFGFSSGAALEAQPLRDVFSFSGAAPFLQHGFVGTGDLLARALLLVGASQLYLGALSLVPLPPLDGGRLLFALAPRSPGWQKAHFQLVERNIGIAVLLALLIIPLGGPLPLLPQLLDSLLHPLLRVLCGG